MEKVSQSLSIRFNAPDYRAYMTDLTVIYHEDGMAWERSHVVAMDKLGDFVADNVRCLGKASDYREAIYNSALVQIWPS